MRNTTSASDDPRLTSIVDRYPWDDVIKMLLYVCGLLSQNPQSQSSYEKNIRQTQIEGYSTKYTTTTQNHQNQAKSKELSWCRGASETWQPNIKQYPGWDSVTTKKDSWWKLNKSGKKYRL